MILVTAFTIISVIFLISGKRKFLMYFVALYPVLPDYFGIELVAGLPLMKASRILLIILFVAAVIYDKRVVVFPKQKFVNSKIYVGILIYFSCRVIANGYYITSLSEAINTEFTIIVEQFLLMVLLLQMIKDENEIIQIIDVIVKVSGIIALVSIINVAIGQNLFYYLKTIERSVMMTSTTRMGIVRAEATFGHPVYYSVYTALMLPLSLYLYQNRKKMKYLILMFMNVVALLLTGTRGTIVVLFFFMIIAFFRMEKKEKEKFSIILSILAFSIVFLSLLDIEILGHFSSIIKSVLVAFGLSDARIENFGGNYATGLDSRWVQLSAFAWTLQSNPVFGLGAGCQNRGKLYYYVNNHWRKTDTIDNGYVGYMAQEGLLGIAAIAALHFSLVKSSLTMAIKEKRENKSGLANMFFLCFVVYIGEMLSVADSSQIFWIIVSLYIAYSNLGSDNTVSDARRIS